MTWLSIMAAAVIGLGMQIGPKEIVEPKPTEPTSAPAPVVLPVKKPAPKLAENVQADQGLTFDEWRRKVMAERIDK
jgi:hypothetical protein